MRKKIIENKTLVGILSILIVALFFGTTLNTAIAINSETNILGEYELGENSGDELPEVATDTVDDTDDEEEKKEKRELVDEDSTSDCPLCDTVKEIEQIISEADKKAAEETVNEVDSTNEKLSALLKKAVSVSEEGEVKTLLKALTEEVISMKQEIASIREEIRSLSGVKQEEISFDTMFETQEEKDLATVFVLGMIGAEPHMEEAQKLSEEQLKFINTNTANKFEQLALETVDSKEREIYELAAAHLKEDFEKVEQIEKTIEQSEKTKDKEDIQTTVGKDKEIRTLEIPYEKDSEEDDLIKLMPKASSNSIGTSGGSFTTSIESECTNGVRKATNAEVNSCIGDYISDHTGAVVDTAEKLGIGSGIYQEAWSSAKEKAKQIIDNTPLAVKVAIGVGAAALAGYAVVNAGGAAVVIEAVKTAWAAGKTEIVKDTLLTIFGASIYVIGLGGLCFLIDCDSGEPSYKKVEIQGLSLSSSPSLITPYNQPNSYSNNVNSYSQPSSYSVQPSTYQPSSQSQDEDEESESETESTTVYVQSSPSAGL